MTNQEFNQILEELYQEDLGSMTLSEIKDKAREIKEEMDQAKAEHEAEVAMYGDFNDDLYNMSDSHRADVQQEKWDWLKNEGS